ncbi:MAG: class I SAM-dependent methyltransferase [Pseudomonadota bacterium]
MNDEIFRWDQCFASGREFNPLNEILLDKIIDYVGSECHFALDLGCGTGDSTIKLARKGFDVTGVDWSRSAVQKARERIEGAGLSDLANVQIANLNHLADAKLTSQLVDMVLCKLVLKYVLNIESFLKATKALMSPTGSLVIITPVLHEGYQYTEREKPETAIDYNVVISLLSKEFAFVEEINHSYFSNTGDLATIICHDQ